MTPRTDRDAKGAILDAAQAVFTERGIDGISMRQIAGEIGVSATALYHHFDSKDALLAATCAAGFAEFGAAMEAAARDAATPLDGLRAAGDAYVDFALTHPMHYDVMMVRPQQWSLGPSPEADPPSFAGFVAVVEACQATGQLRAGDAREIAHQLWATMHGPVSLYLAMPGGIGGLDEDSTRARAQALLEATIASLQ